MYYRNSIYSVAFRFGAITMVSGIIGVPLGTYLTQKLKKDSCRNDPIVCAAGLLISAPLLAGSMLMIESSEPIAYLLVFLGEIALNLNWAIVADILLVRMNFLFRFSFYSHTNTIYFFLFFFAFVIVLFVWPISFITLFSYQTIKQQQFRNITENKTRKCLLFMHLVVGFSIFVSVIFVSATLLTCVVFCDVHKIECLLRWKWRISYKWHAIASIMFLP